MAAIWGKRNLSNEFDSHLSAWEIIWWRRRTSKAFLLVSRLKAGWYILVIVIILKEYHERIRYNDGLAVDNNDISMMMIMITIPWWSCCCLQERFEAAWSEQSLCRGSAPLGSSSIIMKVINHKHDERRDDATDFQSKFIKSVLVTITFWPSDCFASAEMTLPKLEYDLIFQYSIFY